MRRVLRRIDERLAREDCRRAGGRPRTRGAFQEKCFGLLARGVQLGAIRAAAAQSRDRNKTGVARRRWMDGVLIDIDRRNAQFWSELCGSALARSLGITEHTPEALRRFDEAYMELYPYLAAYVFQEGLRGRRVLEIGI